MALESRWALSYLRGPLARADQVLDEWTREYSAKVGTVTPGAARNATPAAQQRTVLPPEISQKFIPARGSGPELVYQPVVFGSAQIRFIDAKMKVDYLQDVRLAAPVKDDNTPVDWEDVRAGSETRREFENEPLAGAEFASLPGDAAKPKCYAAGIRIW